MPILRIIYCATGIYSSVFAGVGTKTGFWIRIYRVQRDVAQFGRALRSGRKGRKFKSCHPDHTVSSEFALNAIRNKIIDFIKNSNKGILKRTSTSYKEKAE